MNDSYKPGINAIYNGYPKYVANDRARAADHHPRPTGEAGQAKPRR